jgi:ABC-type lipoprotein export system ATPase subunit
MNIPRSARDESRHPCPDDTQDFAPPVLETDAVTKTYPSQSPVQALRGCQLRGEPRRAAAIVGPSGSGKTTLLHVMGTLDRPSTGTVRSHERHRRTLDRGPVPLV